MLDTDIASYIIKGRAPRLDQRLAIVPPSDVCISSITRGELLYGVHLRPGELRLARLVEQFLNGVASLPWDDAAADAYGRVAADLRTAGRSIGPFDTMIAAHALALDLTIVTNNVEHFSRVRGLRLQNWLATN
jgi:tRNA(fMet)-specific endonuclease VapC